MQLLVDEVDDAVGVLHDGAGRRAGLEAARVRAVHAAVLADQPFQIARLRVLPLGEAHHREACPASGRAGCRRPRALIADRLAQCRSIPGTPTGRPCSRCTSRVDELGDLVSCARRRDAATPSVDQVRCRDRRIIGRRVETAGAMPWFALPHATAGPAMGSMSTRNALYSGVSMLASPTKGVSEFGAEALLAPRR